MEEDKFNEYLDAAWLSFRKQLLEVGIAIVLLLLKWTGEPRLQFAQCTLHAIVLRGHQVQPFS